MTTYPPTALLTADRGDTTTVPDIHTREILRTTAAAGIKADVERVEHGAAFSRYLLRLEAGADPRKIERLTEALSLAVEVPVRYAGQVGGHVALEVPRKVRQTVTLRYCIERGSAMHTLGFAVGADVGGTPVIAQLANTPHMLIAGATGQGKSVAINALLTALLMRNTPDELELTLIDPKRVELKPYEGLPHLTGPIVTDMTDAATTLAGVVRQMEQRFADMEAAGVKNLTGWNTKMDEHWARHVIVIDELADLMMTHGKAVETDIARIGQLGRAAGIHLVVATQRPSADIVTGKIKANIPSRLAFTTASAVDSKVIGVAGAERLAGAGDALWSPVGQMHPVRVQTPYVSEEEVERVVAWWTENWLPYQVDEDDFDVPAAIALARTRNDFGFPTTEQIEAAVESDVPVYVEHEIAANGMTTGRTRNVPRRTPEPMDVADPMDLLVLELVESMRATRMRGAEMTLEEILEPVPVMRQVMAPDPNPMLVKRLEALEKTVTILAEIIVEQHEKEKA